MMKKGLLLFSLLLLACVARTQDEKFSQFYALPIQINPALTGAYEGTYRLTAVYRDQWYNNLGSSFKTFAAGGDTRFQLNIGNQKQKDHFGVGLFFVSDKVSAYQANSNRISAYFAYHKKLGERNPSYLGAGLQMGINQRNINYDNLTFGDQFNQLDAFDQATMENLPPNNIGIFDISLGLNYYFNVKKSKIYLGVAGHHLNTPNLSYFAGLDNINPSTITDQKLSQRYVAHVSADLPLQYKLELQPRLIYQQQGSDNSLSMGTNIEKLFQHREMGIVFGMWLNILSDLDGTRLSHVTPLVGLLKGGFTFGLSYDWGLQDVGQDPFHLNTFEFSIRFSGETFNDQGFCPSF